VNVSTGSGYIHVYPGTGNQVHIVGHVHSREGWLGTDTEERLRQIVAAPPIEQSGNIVTVSGPHADANLFSNITIDYDVTAPANTRLTAHTGSGGIEIGGIQGEVTASSGSGSLHVDNIGPSAHLESGSGRINATNIHGGAYAQTGSGSITLAISAPGDVTAHTGSGSINIEGAADGVRASTGSGHIEVAGSPTAEWTAHTGSGSIQLHPAPDAHFTLLASTGSGSIRTNRPMVMQGDLSRHRVSGTVNGGGPTVRASTGSGSVSVD
jgi:DUF4097 and DUF4098 domain-containing protein YvlB